MIKTVAQNANTIKPVLLKLECIDMSISLRKPHNTFATLNGKNQGYFFSFILYKDIYTKCNLYIDL